MTKKTNRLVAEETRLMNSRRMLIAGLDRIADRLETRRFALSDQEVCRLEAQMELLQQRLGDVNDRLMDSRIASARAKAASFVVSFPDPEKSGERRTRLCNT